MDVVLKRRLGDNKVYAIIAVFIIIVILLTVIISSSDMNHAYISEDYLTDGWSEDIEARENSYELLNSWIIFTYLNDDVNYPASITVTTKKTLFMMSESELMDETIKTIKDASGQGITIDDATKISGKRVLINGEHQTRYVVYNGTDNSSGVSENVKVIGETWNCGVSGTSIICIGVAQITDNLHSNNSIVTAHWEKIIRDKEGTFGTGEYIGDDGLLFNVKCH